MFGSEQFLSHLTNDEPAKLGKLLGQAMVNDPVPHVPHVNPPFHLADHPLLLHAKKQVADCL